MRTIQLTDGSNSVDRALAMLPELVEKVSALVSKKGRKARRRGTQGRVSLDRNPLTRRYAGSFLLGHESGHSIARPTACGSRVPPQRTVLGETPGTPPHQPKP